MDEVSMVCFLCTGCTQFNSLYVYACLGEATSIHWKMLLVYTDILTLEKASRYMLLTYWVPFACDRR